MLLAGDTTTGSAGAAIKVTAAPGGDHPQAGPGR